MCRSFLWFNVHVYLSKAKALEWNLYPGLKIWKELPAIRKSQSPAYMGLKVGSSGRVGQQWMITSCLEAEQGIA